MKQTDLNAVRNEVESQIRDQEWSVLNYLTRDEAVLAVCNVYNVNDWAKGFGQDFRDQISIISSEKRISTIANGSHSYYKSDTPLCQYEDLADDIHQILMVLETAIQRMEAFW